MKLIPQLHRDHSRLPEMRSAECVAQIDEVPLIRDVGRRYFCRPVFAERLPYGQIDQTIAGQMVRDVAVKKSRSVTEVSGYPSSARHSGGEARAQSLTLVVIEEEEARVWHSEVRESSGDAAGAFHRLVGISQMEVGALKQFGRPQRGFVAQDSHRVDGERHEDVGVAERVMIEKVVRSGAEVAEIDR